MRPDSVIKGLTITDTNIPTGTFCQFELDSASYYPKGNALERIRNAVLGQHKKQRELPFMITRPLAHNAVVGTFLLFLPNYEPVWGMLNLERIVSNLPGINMSLVSPLVLAPRRLHGISGIVTRERVTFYVTDQEESNWSIHCVPKQV